MSGFDAVKQTQQETWATGDFSVIGRNLVYPGELLCEAAELRAGHKVLDVAAGAGNVALSAARRNCEAVGIDYVPQLVERARLRAEAERLEVRFEIADCENIPFPDGAFDRVLSLFGSMFAPDQQRAADELKRVCRPGGKIGMGNWTPEGFWGETFALVSRFRPTAAGVRPATEWGTGKRLSELFDVPAADLRITPRRALFRFRDKQHWVEVFGSCFGPVMRVLESLDNAGRKEFLQGLKEILDRFNCSGDQTLMVGADYLEVVIDR